MPFKWTKSSSVATVDALHPGGASIATGPVVSGGDHSTATFAVGPPLVPTGTSIYLQFSVNPFTAIPVAVSRGFSDLQVALYGSDHPARSNLVAASSRQLAWPGPIASQQVVVGDANWTLIASAPEPLIGTVATIAPLVILILGLCLTLATGVLLELFIRRRRNVLTESESRAGVVEGPPAVTTTPNASAKVSAVSAEAQPAPPAVPVASAEFPDLSEEAPPAPPTVPAVSAEFPDLSAEVVPETPTVSDEPAETLSETHELEDVTSATDQEQQPSESTTAVGQEAQADDVSAPEPSFYADWRPDPFGRFEQRRFFLGSPTSLVKDDSTERYDPVLPDSPPMQEPSDTARSETSEVPQTSETPQAIEADTPPHPLVDDEGGISETREHETKLPPKDGQDESADSETLEHGKANQALINGQGDLSVQPPDTQATLEIVAAVVAETIAEELEGLRGVASALNEYLPELGETMVPAPPTGQVRRHHPPASEPIQSAPLTSAPPPAPTPPPPPPAPPSTSSPTSTSAKVGAQPRSGDGEARPNRSDDDAKPVVTPSSIAEAASLAWQRLKRARRRS